MRINNACSALLLAVGAAASWSCGAARNVADSQAVSAPMYDATGANVGEVRMTEEGAGVRFRGALRGLPPGTHGFHVHSAGVCEPPFTSAGPHFNPTSRKHGRKNPDGWHAGDLPNVQVAADGTVNLDVTVTDVTLGLGSTSIVDSSVKSLILHAQADDEMTDPSGNSGDRIVCGVIKK